MKLTITHRAWFLKCYPSESIHWISVKGQTQHSALQGISLLTIALILRSLVRTRARLAGLCDIELTLSQINKSPFYGPKSLKGKASKTNPSQSQEQVCNRSYLQTNVPRVDSIVHDSCRCICIQTRQRVCISRREDNPRIGSRGRTTTLLFPR